VGKLPANTRAYFIKLGEKGAWEASSIDTGTIKFGYREIPFELCVSGDWEKVRRFWVERGCSTSTATNHMRQIRTFFEASESDLFITFSRGYLWWCHPRGEPMVMPGDGNIRARGTKGGWRNKSLKGEPLLLSRLSGKLTKTQMYRGTICEVEEQSYLLRRINDEQAPEVTAAEAAERVLLDHILSMVQMLLPEDFELLVELIFSSSGWQRQARTGGNQKTIDLDLLLPSTRERAFVQVKSSTSPAEFSAYAEEFSATDAFARMFYVWHSGSIGLNAPAGVTLWGPDVIAGKVLDAGLLAWLKDRAS
jgi:hypothetical protein